MGKNIFHWKKYFNNFHRQELLCSDGQLPELGVRQAGLVLDLPPPLKPHLHHQQHLQLWPGRDHQELPGQAGHRLHGVVLRHHLLPGGGE